MLWNSLQDLQTKVSELESETDRLSSALEAQKAATVDIQAATSKKVEEISKELQRKVGNLYGLVVLHRLSGQRTDR